MIRNNTTRFWLGIVGAFVVGDLQAGAGDSADGPTNVAKALSMVTPEFSVVEKSAGEVIHELNRVSSVPINADIDVSAGARYSISLHNARLEDILASFAEKSKYVWRHDGGGITILDNATKADRENVMNMALDVFEVKDKGKMEAAQELFRRPEVLERKFYVIRFGWISLSLPAEKKLTLRLERATLREILNSLVQADGTSYWILCTKDGIRVFSFGPRPTDTVTKARGG